MTMLFIVGLSGRFRVRVRRVKYARFYVAINIRRGVHRAKGVSVPRWWESGIDFLLRVGRAPWRDAGRSPPAG